ncbi:thiol reductant ABC exporter subunit CydD [Amycolatopsis sp. NBC_00355]|uniref:thiol reductant ABC exporter subunit CydD n=1 Tax=Amycolatopsis sp. NBC_00355 TaxID=2975957 RepID=UPI002E25C1B8
MTQLPGRAPLLASESTVDSARPGKGPLGALPALVPAVRRALALVGFLSFLNAAALVAQAFLLADVLAAIVGAGSGGRAAQLAALIALVATRALTGWAVRTIAARAAATAQRELRAKAVDHALRLGPEWIARRGHGELTALTTRGLDALDAYFREYLPALVTAAVVPLGAGAAILFADWPSGVIVALTVPLLPVFAILVGKFTAGRVAGATDATHRMSERLLELVRVLPVLTAFRRAAAQAETVRKLSERHRRATLKTLKAAFSSAFVLELIATLSVALVAVVIGVRLAGGHLPLAIGLGVLILVPECYQPVRAVGAAFHASEDGVEAVRRVVDLLAVPAPVIGSAVPDGRDLHVSSLRVARRGGFAPDGETFTIRPGETHWLRAPSGGGKSTTLSALLGFVPAHDGSITVGATDLADADLTRWREQVAWVPQSPVFTGGTVREEVGSDAGLAELGLAGLADRPVAKLSLGQRQRVAVARALQRVREGAWLLLLDEPTAHLDETSARLVLDAVQRAVDNGAAAVIAAHERTAAVAMSISPPDAPEPSTKDSFATPLPWRAFLDGRLFGGAALGAVALLAGVALTATSGWLIAKASQQPPILTLTVAVVGVRAFGLGRAGLRYAERLVTHDAAFRIAGRLRVRLWNSLVRLGPARGLRAGEGQRRLVADVDTVRDLLPRVVSPPLVVALVAAGAIAVQAWVLPAAGWTLAAAVAAGLCAPLVALRAERRATSVLATGRRDVASRVLVLFEAAAELLAFGRAAEHRHALAEADTRLVTQARRQAFGVGAAEALVTLACGTAAIVSTAFAAQAVSAGRLDPVLAPLLALVPLALAEVLALLPPVAQHWDTLKQARHRLADTPDGAAKVAPRAGQGKSVAASSRPAGAAGAAESRAELATAGMRRATSRQLAEIADAADPPVEVAAVSGWAAAQQPAGFGGATGSRAGSEAGAVGWESAGFEGAAGSRADSEVRAAGWESADFVGAAESCVESEVRAAGRESAGFVGVAGSDAESEVRAAAQQPAGLVGVAGSDAESEVRAAAQQPAGFVGTAGSRAEAEVGAAGWESAGIEGAAERRFEVAASRSRKAAGSRSAGVASAARALVEIAGPSAELETAVQVRNPSRDHEVPSVELRGADLGWPDGPVVLRGVDLALAPGTYAAVVGGSGAGKSTLVAALLGFLAPTRGVVSAPEGVVWAPQEPMLAATTVGENLRLARPAATEDELREALHRVALDDVEPATVLGSGGSGLSGGQAQRVALARALLGAPSAGLVLLDEPTAHLDEPTARVVRARLREALAGRTVVHVTHRADEAEDADVVLEVRDGRVVTRVPVAGAT